jgi:hypothetical protein
MRGLCDQNIPRKYVNALEDAKNITVTTVGTELQHDASDAEISAYAEHGRSSRTTTTSSSLVANTDSSLRPDGRSTVRRYRGKRTERLGLKATDEVDYSFRVGE